MDRSLLGEHTLEAQIFIDNNPYSIPIIDHIVKVPVSIRCTDPELIIEEWTPPSVWGPESHEESHTWQVPTYTVCLVPHTALVYEFYAGEDEIQTDPLTWLQVDPQSNLISAKLSL